MHLSGHDGLLLLGLLLRSCLAFTNDATERLFPQSSASNPGELQARESLNRARSGGRGSGRAHDTSEKGQIGCRELRSTKYISDGHCTSVHPIKELVCAGECLPAQLLPNWIGGTHGSRHWGKRSGPDQDWRCVNDKTRTQRIRLQCQDGSARTYKITVVTSCKCKRYTRQHNESGSNFEEGAVSSPQLLHKSKSKRKQGKNRLVNNWQDLEP